jgi:hypothetical protein
MIFYHFIAVLTFFKIGGFLYFALGLGFLHWRREIPFLLLSFLLLILSFYSSLFLSLGLLRAWGLGKGNSLAIFIWD